VIDTATNKVVAASGGKGIADGIAFTPDGQHTYIANTSRISTAYTALPQVLDLNGNSITLNENESVYALAITPDGKSAYVPYVFFNSTSSPPENATLGILLRYNALQRCSDFAK
jgi:DNA-binding beta-propeller fold protein YncE